MISTDGEIDLAVSERYDESMRLHAAFIERGQLAGVFRRGDPEVLARLLSAMIAAYQSLDPSVIADESDAGERLPLAELHEIIEDALSLA
jgi:AcrR family transcriptional regulator